MAFLIRNSRNQEAVGTSAPVSAGVDATRTILSCLSSSKTAGGCSRSPAAIGDRGRNQTLTRSATPYGPEFSPPVVPSTRGMESEFQMA